MNEIIFGRILFNPMMWLAIYLVARRKKPHEPQGKTIAWIFLLIVIVSVLTPWR